MDQFELTYQDRKQPLWLKLKAHFEDRLADARRQNDRLHPEYETALLRGEIKCLKALIAMDADRPMTGQQE